MNRKWIGCVILMTVLAPWATTRARAQTPVVRELLEQATEQIVRSTARQGLEELSEFGGRAAVREVLEQSSREGGEQLVRRVTQYGVEEGPLALRVIRPAPARMVSAIDGLSPELRSAGLRLIDREPALMGRLVEGYGTDALQVAMKHPGVGEQLVGSLGVDGMKLGKSLTTDEAIIAARNAPDLAALAPAERSGVIGKILKSPGPVLDYLESHPRILRTAAGVAVVMAIKDDILGDKGRDILRPDGSVVTTAAHPGLIERLYPKTLAAASSPIGALAWIVGFGVAGWFAIHLWGKWRVQSRRVRA